MKRITARTIEGFLKKLREDGLSEYATELKLIVAMSRRRKKAKSGGTIHGRRYSVDSTFRRWELFCRRSTVQT